MSVRPVPEGHHTVTPYLRVDGASKLIEFLKKAFDAADVHRTLRKDGTIRHGEIKIGDSYVWIADVPAGQPRSETTIHLYVPDVDVTYRRALAAGAQSVSEPQVYFYGDRGAGVKDFTGTTWWIATHVEDVSPDEIDRRAALENV